MNGRSDEVGVKSPIASLGPDADAEFEFPITSLTLHVTSTESLKELDNRTYNLNWVEQTHPPRGPTLINPTIRYPSSLHRTLTQLAHNPIYLDGISIFRLGEGPRQFLQNLFKERRE